MGSRCATSFAGDDVGADRQRDRRLAKHGWQVLRFMQDEIERSPRSCARQVLAIMEAQCPPAI